MAFQGKGILGGFSGKIGSIVGYIRNDKAIIQSIGKRKGDVTRVVWVLKLVKFLENVDCITGNYFVEYINTVTNRRSGAIAPVSFSGSSFGISGKFDNLNNQIGIGFAESESTSRAVNGWYGYWIQNNRVYFMVNSQLINLRHINYVGKYVKVIMRNLEVFYYVSDDDINYILEYQAPYVKVPKAYPMVSMTATGDKITNLKIGGFGVKEI